VAFRPRNNGPRRIGLQARAFFRLPANGPGLKPNSHLSLFRGLKAIASLTLRPATLKCRGLRFALS